MIRNRRDPKDMQVDAALARELRKEWGAVDGTLQDLQRRTCDPVILARVETIIIHMRKLGNLECAIKNSVVP